MTTTITRSNGRVQVVTVSKIQEFYDGSKSIFLSDGKTITIDAQKSDRTELWGKNGNYLDLLENIQFS